MLKITPEGETGQALKPFGYIQGRGVLGRYALQLTRWLRAIHAEKYLQPAERHLDIGCGDGYFLRRSPCTERYGLDKQLGDEVTDRLDFDYGFFDVVTLLAVIEHVEDPESLLKEIARVLKPGGRLIFTTPKRAADGLLKLYAREIDEEHETYLDLKRVRQLAEGKFEVEAHHTFIFGLNQAFCLRKPVKG